MLSRVNTRLILATKKMARKRINNDVPTFDELLVPTIKALHELGGSGSIEEINSKVYVLAEISDETLQVPHGEEGTVSEVDYRLAWSRTYLKKFGLLENSSRGIWALSKSDITINELDPIEIVKTVREQSKLAPSKSKTTSTEQQIENEITKEVDNLEGWKEQLLDVLYNITPAAFERLSQRLLRESGFFKLKSLEKLATVELMAKALLESAVF